MGRAEFQVIERLVHISGKVTINYLRCAWIECKGVPIYAWTENTFVNIAKIWGEFLDLDNVTPSLTMFESAKVLIVTERPEIIWDKIILKVNDVDYVVYVCEMIRRRLET